MTMAYILAGQPSILSASGMDANAVLIATSLASFVGTALMALLAQLPVRSGSGLKRLLLQHGRPDRPVTAGSRP